MSLKLFLVTDGNNTKYWIGADTRDEAISFAKADIELEFEDEALFEALDGITVKELNASKETVYDEEESETISWEKCFTRNENGKGIYACSEWY